jgi:cyclopropane fatty-acyl-phospholipid synthase-like methyltransferase
MKYCKDYLNYKLLDHLRHFRFGSPLLEVGCGTGETLMEISKEYDAIGIDLSDEALASCRAKGLRVQKLDLSAITETFESIVCVDVIEHIKDDRPFVKKLHAALNRKGKLFVLVPSGKMLQDDHVFGHYRRYSRDEIVNLLKDGDFNIESVESFGYPFFYLARLLANALHKPAGCEEPDRETRTLRSSYEHPFDGTIFCRALTAVSRIPLLSKLLQRVLLLQDLFARADKGFAFIVIASKP